MIKRTHFLSLKEIKASVTKELKRLKKEDFTECFCGWQDCMQVCIEEVFVKGQFIKYQNMLH